MSSIARMVTRNFGDLPLDSRSCQLLGPTALVVQALMGVLAVLSLVYKRHRETQKRPWTIWLYDVSKQVCGQMFVHGLNVLISDIGSHHFAGNACTYYFLNFLFDTTLGIVLLYVALQSATWILSTRLGIKGLKTGQYGNPPLVTFWVRQTAVYVFSITTMKLLGIALFAAWPGISSVGDWLLSWTALFEDEESAQVIFVMGIFPVFMNILQFWMIDSIVKGSTNPATIHSSPRNSDSEDCEPLFSSADDDDDVAPRDVENVPQSSSSTTSDGDLKTLVGRENDKAKQSASGSSSPIVLPRTPTVATHDYPPNNVTSVSSRSSTRSRHKYKRSTPSLLGISLAYASPALDALGSPRNGSRQALLSRSLDDDEFGGVAGIDTWEKDEWERRAHSETRSGRVHTVAR